MKRQGSTQYENRPYKKVRATKKKPYMQTQVSSISRGGLQSVTASMPATRSEVKALDIPISTAALNGTGSIIGLNFIRAGSSFFNRIGRKIELKNLQLECRLQLVDDAAGRNPPLAYNRIIVVYDRQTNGAFPAIQDVLQDVDQAGTNSTDVMSEINLNNRERFTILRDWRFLTPDCSTQQVGAGNMQMANSTTFPDSMGEQSNGLWKFFIPLKGLNTQYKADSAPAVIGDIATGGLYLITFGSLTAGVEAFELLYSTRLRYWDK